MEDHPQIALIEAQMAAQHERSFTSFTQLDDWDDRPQPEFNPWKSDDEKAYLQARASLNGKRIQLKVPHPFQNQPWEIIAPAPEPQWFICRCVEHYDCNGVAYFAYFPQAFERSEFEVIQ